MLLLDASSKAFLLMDTVQNTVLGKEPKKICIQMQRLPLRWKGGREGDPKEEASNKLHLTGLSQEPLWGFRKGGSDASEVFRNRKNEINLNRLLKNHRAQLRSAPRRALKETLDTTSDAPGSGARPTPPPRSPLRCAQPTGGDAAGAFHSGERTETVVLREAGAAPARDTPRRAAQAHTPERRAADAPPARLRAPHGRLTEE